MTLSVSLRHRLGGFLLDSELMAPGGVTGLLGRSGSGRTTRAKAVAGLIHRSPAPSAAHKRRPFERAAMRLVSVSIVIAMSALILLEWLARRLARRGGGA
ncbi:hypothetical protein [Cognatishimia sp. F0-27]|uniref:hypothetical protein n=1 Tax=Cognatishimia sp. F0-27 TaxID=2816855 RepID=UPI001D0CD29E|nr:hypothetical protein [Cognatishimia sp. F0-27]MCC1491138.1 hypothetical protein [Cognatishimia sp. F0-27]